MQNAYGYKIHELSGTTSVLEFQGEKTVVNRPASPQEYHMVALLDMLTGQLQDARDDVAHLEQKMVTVQSRNDRAAEREAELRRDRDDWRRRNDHLETILALTVKQQWSEAREQMVALGLVDPEKGTLPVQEYRESDGPSPLFEAAVAEEAMPAFELPQPHPPAN